MVPIKFPQWSHPKIVEVQKRRLKIVEREIDRVIAVSQSTKEDLMNVSSIPKEKITVIYEGVEADFKPQQDKFIQEFKKKYNLPESFVLAIGGIGERKNLKRIKQAAKGYNLVILGETLTDIPKEELPLLYGSAKVLLYPSLYEGFGLPVLEAMACGIPVVTSNTSSLPEVGGEAAIYVEPASVDKIQAALKEVINDEQLRKDLIERGLEQVKKFSWEKCAQETAQIYRELSPNR